MCHFVCLSAVVPCLQLLSGSVVDEGVAQYSFHHMFHSALLEGSGAIISALYVLLGETQRHVDDRLTDGSIVYLIDY